MFHLSMHGGYTTMCAKICERRVKPSTVGGKNYPLPLFVCNLSRHVGPDKSIWE